MKGLSSSDLNRLWDSTQNIQKTSLGAIYDSPDKFKLSSRFELKCTQKSILDQFCNKEGKEGDKKSIKKRKYDLKKYNKKFIFETLNNQEVCFKFDPDCPGVFTLKSIQEVIKSTKKNPGSPSIRLQNLRKKKLKMQESILSSSSESDSDDDDDGSDSTNKYVQYPSVLQPIKQLIESSLPSSSRSGTPPFEKMGAKQPEKSSFAIKNDNKKAARSIQAQESELPSSSDSNSSKKKNSGTSSDDECSISSQSFKLEKKAGQLETLSIEQHAQKENTFGTVTVRGTQAEDQEKEFTSYIKHHFDQNKNNCKQSSSQNMVSKQPYCENGDKKAQKIGKKVMSQNLEFFEIQEKMMKNKCPVCEKPLGNNQILVCINVCDHFYHEDCLIEAILSSKNEKTGEENFNCLKCNNYGRKDPLLTRTKHQ